MSDTKYGKIYRVVNLVPEGKVASYGQIADLAGIPGRARLVGKALGGLPSQSVSHEHINWHRIIRSNGQIAFEASSENALKQKGLLQEEGVAMFNNRVKMRDFQWQPDLHVLLHELSF